MVKCPTTPDICRYTVDPVVDRVGRNDRLGCFVDRLHRLVDDFTTRLDLADFRSTWSTGGHFYYNFLLVLAHWQLTRKILCPSTWCLPTPSSKWKAYSFPFLLPPLNIFVVGSCDHKMRSMRPVAKLLWPLVELYQRHCGRENECGI